METLKTLKAECRKKILETRQSLKPEDMAVWDDEIMKRLITVPFISALSDASEKQDSNKANTVYCYIGVRGETGTASLIKYFLNLGLRVAVPRIDKKIMHFYYINSHADLEPGGFGIPEPVSSCEKAACKDAPVIVPGVAFSRMYERTGYGAGYYDKFFAEEPEHEKIAVCYDFQLFEKIASNSFDVPMDYIVTPSEILCRKGNEDA